MPRVIAIDLGSHSAKLSVWRGSGRRYVLEARHAAQVITDGAMPAMGERLAAAGALLKNTRGLVAPGTVAVLAWPMQLASLHPITVPFTDPRQVEKTLPFAVESEVPFNLDEMVLGWRVVAKGQGTDCMVALTQKEALSSAISALGHVRVEPRQVFVDAEILAAWAPEDGLHAVIDVGHARTVVAVVNDGELRLSRCIDVGGWHFTRALQQALEVSWEEAEAIKCGELVPGTDEDVDEPTDPGPLLRVYSRLPKKARDALDGVIGTLLAEVRSTLLAAEDQLGREVLGVQLTGGGSKLGAVHTYLKQDLGVPIEPLTAVDGDLVPESYAVADALGGRATGGAGHDAVDLRAGALAWKSGGDWLRGLIVYGGGALVVCTFAVLVLYGWQSWSYSSETSAVQRRLDTALGEAFPGEKIRTTSEALSKLSKLNQEAKARAGALSGGMGGPMTTLLEELSTAVPVTEVKVDLQSLTLTPTSVTLDAETDSYASAERVEEALQATERFKGAAKGKDSQSRDKIRFTVQIPLNTEAAPADGEEG